MPSRICPKCQQKLGEHDSHFCTSCGAVLPKDLVSVSSRVRVRTYSPSEPEVSKGPLLARLMRHLKDTTLWAVLGLLVFILFVLVGIARTGAFELLGLKLQVNRTISEMNFPNFPATPKYQNLSLNLTLPEAIFDSTSLLTHVPADVDFYFEGSGLQEAVDLNLFVEEDEELNTRAKLLLDPNFAGFMYEEEEVIKIGFIFIPKDVTLAEEVFTEFVEDSWKFAIIEDYMLVTNDDDVFDLVKSVDDGIKKSLAQNPEYVKRVQTLSAVGQFRVLFMTEGSRNMVRNSLGGLTQETIGMINKVLISSYDSLVVTNTNGEK